MGPSLAYLAMGCFWCGEADFEKLGCKSSTVGDVISGFTGGATVNPSYKQVVSGGTGHYEAIKVPYDTTEAPTYAAAAGSNNNIDLYDALLYHFWTNVHPFQSGGQFCDFGKMYRARIFYTDQTQKTKAERSLALVKKAFKEEASTGAGFSFDLSLIDSSVLILPFDGNWYDAEAYHQNFWNSCAVDCVVKYGACCNDRYSGYRAGCGRDDDLDTLWGPTYEPNGDINRSVKYRFGLYMMQNGDGSNATVDLSGKTPNQLKSDWENLGRSLSDMCGFSKAGAPVTGGATSGSDSNAVTNLDKLVIVDNTGKNSQSTGSGNTQTSSSRGAQGNGNTQTNTPIESVALRVQLWQTQILNLCFIAIMVSS